MSMQFDKNNVDTTTERRGKVPDMFKPRFGTKRARCNDDDGKCDTARVAVSSSSAKLYPLFNGKGLPASSFKHSHKRGSKVVVAVAANVNVKSYETLVVGTICSWEWSSEKYVPMRDDAAGNDTLVYEATVRDHRGGSRSNRDPAALIRVRLRPDKGTLFVTDDVYDEIKRASKCSRIYNFTSSMLKSIVQKNVRMGRPGAATRAALLLAIRGGPMQLLRRVMIIALEDALLHPRLTWIVGIMLAASKGYAITRNDISTVLCVVHELAAVNLKDSCDGVHCAPPLVWEQLECLTDAARCVVKSLIVRACYGGMAVDVEMMRNFAAVWLQRLGGDGEPLPHDAVIANMAEPSSASDSYELELTGRGIEPADAWLAFVCRAYDGVRCHLTLEEVGYMVDSDVILSAVDFHCSPVVQIILRNDNNTIPVIRQYLDAVGMGGSETRLTKLMTSMIWDFRSSLTVKLLLYPQHEQARKSLQSTDDATKHQALGELYELIKEDIDDIARQIIAKRLHYVN